ncbi:MAG: pyridoxamine 5'-phosphate oxidase family protein, partial [Actinobacteria bacterium]|nr:pyridoxamine 5'-phosphate oxidase family protein [Actinomycetota bacterium]
MSNYARLAFTDGVRRVQAEHGAELPASRRIGAPDGSDRFGERESAFIERLDGCYLATVGETGWPYVQFRGGPPGFLHVLDEHTLGFAVVRGNRQYITTGNLRTDYRVAMFFLDHARQ